MLIAKQGKYTIRHKKFLGRQRLTTHQIQLCCNSSDTNELAIAYIDDATHNLVSYSCRLVESITCEQDVKDLKILTKLLYNIHETEEVDIE